MTAAVEPVESRRVCSFRLSLIEVTGTEQKEDTVLLAGVSEELDSFVFSPQHETDRQQCWWLNISGGKCLCAFLGVGCRAMV